VIESGGVPVLLPPSGGPSEAAACVAAVAGLILIGGPDLDPARYRAARDSRTVGVQPVRDAWEADLLAAALAARRPVLGICRGAQLLNIARGGTLRQHLPEHVGHDGHRPVPGAYGIVTVNTDPDMLPGIVLDPTIEVRCSHHQAVDELGAGLVATAWHADGTIEAVCLPEYGFVVGVQWHPEAGADLRLFQALVSAALSPAAQIRIGS
jgi:putative glutamine amidotransferase